MSVVVLGPTGEYPNGKLGSDDQGELTIAIGAEDGLVKLEFGTPVAWLAVSPSDAATIAASLLHMAKRAEGEQV